MSGMETMTCFDTILRWRDGDTQREALVLRWFAPMRAEAFREWLAMSLNAATNRR